MTPEQIEKAGFSKEEAQIMARDFVGSDPKTVIDGYMKALIDERIDIIRQLAGETK